MANFKVTTIPVLEQEIGIKKLIRSIYYIRIDRSNEDEANKGKGNGNANSLSIRNK